MYNSKTPPVEYHVCQVIGHGYKFVPAYVKSKTRMKKEINAGYLAGVVIVLDSDMHTKFVDANKEAHPQDRTYDLSELPSSDEQQKMISRLQKEYPMEERVVIVRWEQWRGRMVPVPTMAPVGFQIPVVTEDTRPENTAEPRSLETAPLEVPLGEAARMTRKQKKHKKDQEHQEQEEA